tara:strand:+ start:126 stop:437 length:312 start_codon:yes stop_codon:yes gene_type:complete
MFIWFVYTLSVIFVCYFLSSFFYKRVSKLIFFLLLILFLTPNSIEINSEILAPSIFIFFYDLLLEQKLSLRALRTLALSLPLSIIFLWLTTQVKKRFFRFSGS